MATLASTDSTPKKVSKANTEGCKICGTATLANARVIISNSNGKSKIGQDFQAYCSIDVGAEKGVTAYCCRGCKLKLETVVKKIIDMRESFIYTNKEKTKRFRLPTGESPQLKKNLCSRPKGDSGQTRLDVFKFREREFIAQRRCSCRERKNGQGRHSIPSKNKQPVTFNGRG